MHMFVDEIYLLFIGTHSYESIFYFYWWLDRYFLSASSSSAAKPSSCPKAPKCPLPFLKTTTPSERPTSTEWFHGTVCLLPLALEFLAMPLPTSTTTLFLLFGGARLARWTSVLLGKTFQCTWEKKILGEPRIRKSKEESEKPTTMLE